MRYSNCGRKLVVLLDELGLVSKPILEYGRLYTKELGDDAGNIHAVNDSCICVTTAVDAEFDVAQVGGGSSELACLGNMSLRQSNGLSASLSCSK